MGKNVFIFWSLLVCTGFHAGMVPLFHWAFQKGELCVRWRARPFSWDVLSAAQRKTWGNQLPGECFCLGAPQGSIYWVNNLDGSVPSIWTKSCSKSSPCQPFDAVQKAGEQGCHCKVKSRIFAVKMKYILCLSPEGVSVRTITYPGAGIGETLISVELDSDKLFILRE